MGKAQTITSNGIPSVLKRNMACHQCRRRKLKCDAQRPCATCKRSHANQLATAMPGTDVPPEPVCTYDELPEPKEAVEKHHGEGGIRAKYERLEMRIAELEGQLKEKDAAVAAVLSAATGGSSVHPHHHHHHQVQGLPPFHPLRSATTTQLSPLARLSIQDPFDHTVSPSNHGYPTPFSASSGHNIADLLQQQQQQQNSAAFNLHLPQFDRTTGFPLDVQTPGTSAGLPQAAPQENVSPVSASTGGQKTGIEPPSATNGAYSSLLWSSWPERLPNPNLFAHLVETFFTCHPHATRLLHRPTFLASLQLPPSHADFPALSLLHAICALASLWSPLVAGDEVELNKGMMSGMEEKDAEGRSKKDWFGEMHARWSREEEERNATEGTGVFQGLQSIVVLTWYYYAHARWVEVWLYTSKALRYAVPMGLNTTPTHGPLLRSWTMPSILGPPKDAIEAEMRRTTFWLAYCYERWQAASTGWAMGLDDEDISQVLSLPLKDFEAGLTLHPELRQRISTPRMLTLHIPEQTDSFTLYVKGTILFSKVKNFNIRFKSKYYYAVASSCTHGDRFGRIGQQPQSQSQRQPQQQQQQQQAQQVNPQPQANGVADQTMTDDARVTSSAEAKLSRGPSPDMAPLATLASTGPLSLLSPGSTTPTPALGINTTTTTTTSSSTNGGASFGSPIGWGPERIDPRDTPSFRAVDGLIEGFRTSFPKNLRDPVQDGRVDSELYVACLVPHVATILLHDPHADPYAAAPPCKSAEKLLIAARSILDLVYILCSTSFDVTLLDPVASFAWFLAARVFVRFIKARLDSRRWEEAVAMRGELEYIRLALKKMGERVPLGYRQSKMLDDLLANEVGTALDNPAGYVYPFASLSPDANGNVANLPPSGSPPAADGITLQHRNSFSAQGAPNLAHRDSLSFPPPGSQRNSFSAPGEGMPIPAASSLPGDGITKGVGFDRLPLHNGNFDSIQMSHGQEGAANGHTRNGSYGSVADVHRKFLDSMKSLDEREVEIAGLDMPPTTAGSGGGGGGRLEMLLGEMVDDGDGDGVFGGVSTMGVLGPMSGLSPTTTLSMAGMGYGPVGAAHGALGMGAGGVGALSMAGMGMSLSGAPSPSPLSFGPGVGFSGDFSW